MLTGCLPFFVVFFFHIITNYALVPVFRTCLAYAPILYLFIKDILLLLLVMNLLSWNVSLAPLKIS